MHHINRFDSGLGDAGTFNSGGKRLFDQVEGDETQGLPRQRQRLPNLSSVVIEAIKMDHLQKMCSSLEPILRKVVGEEVERALARLLPNRLESRTSPGRIQGSTQSDLYLYFTSKLALPLFTGGKVEGEGGLPVHIMLKDDFTKEVVTSGPLSSTKLEVVVLDGDFANEDEDWTAEDFEKYVVKERDGKRPLLAGDLNVSLKDGVGTLGDLVFTDNSSWIRSRKFRLGVRVARGFAEGVRIKESKTEAFTVKDHRGELYKKHYPPNLNDDVWRLDRIGKDGAFHKRLQEQNIRTVEDFLRLYMMDQHKLRTILGNGMSNKMWDNTIEHAKTCMLSGKLYVYYADGTHNIGVIFNNIYELLGVTSNNTYKSAESLDENEKVYVDKLVKVAYENWTDMVEYENGAHGNESSSNHGLGPPETENNRVTHELTGIFNQHMSLPQQSGQLQSVSTPTSIMVTSGRPAVYGYGSESSVGYASQGSQIIQSNQVYNSAVDPHRQSSPIISVHSFPTNGGPANTGVSRGPMILRNFGEYTTPVMSQLNWASLQTPADYYVNEEDIRAQAATLLNHDELQQQLLLYPFARPENSQLQGESAYFEGFTPSPTYREDGVRLSGKGYVGWLKLKAALRWGIFIRRKIAAKKAIQKAQLEEIED